MSGFKSSSRILTASNSLQPLMERAHYLQALTRQLREAVDPVLAEHISLANLKSDTAIIIADSPVWLANIRYLAPDFLRLLQQQPGLEKLRKIQFKVQPANPAAQAQTEIRRASLSTDSAELLESTANDIQDKELAQALQRLATRAEKKPAE